MSEILLSIEHIHDCGIFDRDLKMENIKSIISQCEEAAKIVNAKAPIRIDCRADKSGEFYLFDLNSAWTGLN